MSVESLREMQASFGEYSFLRVDNDMPEKIKDNGLSSTQRLQVYRNNVFFLLNQAMSLTYPVVESLVGDKFFKQLSRDYMRKFPSKSGDINDFGSNFSNYLQVLIDEKSHYLDSLSYLGDVAKFEWLYQEVFNEADCQAVNVFEKMMSYSEDEQVLIQFELNPASRLFSSKFPIFEIWKNNVSEEAESEIIDLSNQIYDRYYMIGRRDFEIIVQTIDPNDVDFLKGCAANLTIEVMLEKYPNLGENFSELLVKHVQCGTIVDCNVN